MSAVIADVVAARVPERSWRSEVRAVKTVWKREVIRFTSNRTQMAMGLVQPLLFLFVVGGGLETLSRAGTEGVDLKTFIFPGVLCMSVMFTAIFSAASIVWDRELGFMKEMLIAPVSRSSIIIGKCLGGATQALPQGVIVLALSGLVDVPYDPLLLLGVFGLLVLVAFSLTAFGALVAVTIKQAQSFTFVMQLVVMPLFFLSGAYFPVTGLPGWLEVLNRVNPITYAVDPMRRLVFSHIDASTAAQDRLAPGLTWFGWHLPALFEAAMVLLLGLALLTAAVVRFSRTE